MLGLLAALCGKVSSTFLSLRAPTLYLLVPQTATWLLCMFRVWWGVHV